MQKFVNKAVAVEEQEEYKSKHAFEDFYIDDRLKRNVAAKGYKNPTPIQDQAIPHLLQGTLLQL